MFVLSKFIKATERALNWVFVKYMKAADQFPDSSLPPLFSSPPPALQSLPAAE